MSDAGKHEIFSPFASGVCNDAPTKASRVTRFSWRVGIVSGVLVFILTRNLLMAGLVLILCRFGLPLLIPYWYFPRESQRASREPHSAHRPKAHAKRRRERSGIEVRCRVVHERGQEWVSTTTGRAYDVTPSNGLPGAQPGDLGYVSFTSYGWRVEPHESARYALSHTAQQEN